MRDVRVPGASARRARAIDEVETWITSLPGGVRRLTEYELRSYAQRFVQGWRFQVAFEDHARRMDLLLDPLFPRTAARFAVVDRPEFLAWPHVEKDGVLCLLPEMGSVSVARPLPAVQALFGSAVELVEECASGANEQDLRDEFRSYWARAATPSAPHVVTLLRPGAPSREVRVWRGDRLLLAGDDDDAIRAWLRNRMSPSGNLRIESGVLLWPAKPPLPNEYPRTALDSLLFARRVAPDVAGNLEQLAANGDHPIVVILGARTPNGPCFGGLIIDVPTVGNRRAASVERPLFRGFREGRVPAHVMSQRRFGSTRAVRAVAERADASWIHGRDLDARLEFLRKRRVVIVGCGSVGAPVAVALAQAGVGTLDLIDPEVLAFANVGRHPLGADDVAQNKAKALAGRLRTRFPHANGITGHARRWEDVVHDSSAVFNSADLIVSAMGDWAAEGALNEWHLAGRRRLPILYAWTEAHACAGHAVLIGDAGGCFQCGLNDHGAPCFAVTEWPAGPTTRAEPGCGSVFQPYGPVELSHVTAVAAELAVDSLLGVAGISTHRVWAARKALLESCGGRWTPVWLASGGSEAGGLVRERTWGAVPNCPECGVDRR